MKGNKKYIFLLIALCVTALVFSAIFLIKRNAVVDENMVTRHEWIQMLGERFGVNEYTDKTASEFNGEDYATGQFIALTAMESIGESKFRLCLDTEETITDDAYIEFALEHGLIEEEKLNKGFSEEECEQVLENLKSIYFGELWVDDYSEVTYQDGVIELASKEVLQSNADCSEIIVSNETLGSLEVGDIIVFEQKNTKIKFAREITGISSDGTLSLNAAELDKVVESLTESDITELTFEDIVNYYGLDEKIDAISNIKYQQTDAKFINTRVFSNENSKGFKIFISTEGEDKERHIEIKIMDKSTGISYSIPISNQIESDDNEYSAEIDIDRIYIGGQIDYSILSGLKYAEAAVDVHATFKSEVKAKEEKKIRLLKTAIPLGNGIAQADIELYIILSVDGSISFEAELPIEVSVSYENNRGLRNFESNFSAEEPKINVNCNASAVLRIEPTLVILGCFNVMDIEADVGVTASAEVVTHSNSQICTDISASFPVFSLSVCGDDDVDTIVGDLGLSAEWEIISSENAPIQLGLHYECLPDESTQFVEKCTYSESEEKDVIKKTENVKENALIHTYFTRYGEITQTDSSVFAFDYPDNWSISKEEVNGNSTDFGEYAKEVVEITNERNVKITFINFDSFVLEAGARGHYYCEYEAEKMTDALLVLSNESSNLVVAKLTEGGSIITDMMTDEESELWYPDSELISYALMPENDIDRYGGSLSAMGAAFGYYEMISFGYPAQYVFYAEAPDGQFTETEEKEVIAILQSFREVN